MQIETIKTLFSAASKIDEIKAGIKDFIKNPENSWEDRQWVWENCPEQFMYRECYMMDYDFTEGEEISWYDDFCVERHEIVVCRDLEGSIGWSGFKGKRNEEIEWSAFKKHCIENGIQSFEFDW